MPEVVPATINYRSGYRQYHVGIPDYSTISSTVAHLSMYCTSSSGTVIDAVLIHAVCLVIFTVSADQCNTAYGGTISLF
jgi:hypothetical protein